ncbi:MAG: hypothetical protein WCR97_03945 [Bacilli bacterium]
MKLRVLSLINILLIGNTVPIFNAGIEIAESIFNVDTLSFDDSYVLDDLYSSEQFDILDYVTDTNNKTLEPIDFVEFGYDSKKNLNNYALYLYLYNPSLIEYDFDSDLNKIELSFGNNSYNKYSLEFLNKSDDSKFLKYKINLNDSTISNLKESLVNEKRLYQISGYEVLIVGNKNPTEYKLGGTFTYTGFGKGLNADDLNTSTLAHSVEDIETLSLDTTYTYWRKANDENNFDQIDSVYFSIPDSTLDKYGNLQGIKFEYDRERLTPGFVLRDSTYDIFKNWVGAKITETNRPNYELWEFSTDDSTQYSYGVNSFNEMPILFNGESSPLDYKISCNELEEYLYDYKKSYFDGYGYNNLSNDLFCNDKKLYLEKTIDSTVYGKQTRDLNSVDKVSFTSDNFDINNSFWSSLSRALGIINTSTYIYDCLEKIDDSILDKTSDDYFVNSEDFSNLKTSFKTNKVNSNSTYLLRFANSNYFQNEVYDHKIGDLTYEGVDGYVFREDVYLGFDIIQLTFVKDGVSYVIPVVMDPTNLIADVEYIDVEQTWLKVLKIILAIVCGILLIWLLSKIFSLFGISFKDIFNTIFVKPVKWIKKKISSNKRRKK